MSTTVSKTRKFVTLVIAVLMVVSSATFAFPQKALASEPGVYLLTTQPSYDNPDTGEIEDRGSNQALGESMVSGVLGSQALLEVSEAGKSYITIRFGLMDNINDVQVYYREAGQTDFTSVSYTVTQENAAEHEADMRFEVPDVNVLIRLEFHVIPMGRNVIFFSTFANAVAGEGDFVVDEILNAPTTDTAARGIDSAQVDEPESNVMMYVIIGVAAVAVIAVIGVVAYRSLSRRRS